MSPDHAAFTDARALSTKRAEVEAAVADLIDLLDAIDAVTAECEPDADIEPGGDDELSLGAPERHPTPDRHFIADNRYTDTFANCRQTNWAAGCASARRDEGEVDDEPEDGGDDEPSLGAVNVRTAGIVDSAFSAHFTEGVDQTTWSGSGTDDLEAGDDNGLGDRDGYEEQFHLEDNRGMPFAPYEFKWKTREAARDAAHAALDRIEAIRRRKGCATVARDRDEIGIVDRGLFMWPSRRRQNRGARF